MRAVAIKLGLFVLVCLVFTTYLAFTIGNVQFSTLLGRHTYTVSATFDDVTGLLVNDNVKIAGVKVGKVTGVKVVKGRALVTAQVDDRYKLPVDTGASIRWRNLLGQRYVYLYPGTASTMLRDGGHIDTTKSVVDLGALFNRLGPIVKALDPNQINTFIDSVAGALDGNESKLRGAIDDLATVTSSLAQRDDAIGRLLTNLDTVTGAITARDAQIRQVLDNLVTIAGTFSANTQTVDSAITGVSSISADLARLLHDNQAQVDGIIGNLTTLVGVVQAHLPDVTPALVHLSDAAYRLFSTSRYGEWLNQVIPCGAVSVTPTAAATLSCSAVAGLQDGLGNALHLPALDQLLGGLTAGAAAPAAAAGAATPAVASPPAGPVQPGVTAPVQLGTPTPNQLTSGVAAITQIVAAPVYAGARP